MNILKKKERGYQSFSEKYDLNNAYAGCPGVPVGVLLLYLLAQDSEVTFLEFTAEAESELGTPHEIWNETAVSTMVDVKKLAAAFKEKECVIWELVCQYQGAETRITGRTYGTVLSARTPLTAKVNLLPLFSRMETATYEYHPYDKTLVEAMKKRFEMNQKVALTSLIKLEKYREIYEEFVAGMKGESFVFPTDNAITVEGYTAQMLFEKFPLSELGAYNYLIYLKEVPAEALEDLKKGLPRK